MEEIINELIAGLFTMLLGSIVATIKMWSDVQGMKKDVVKLELSQDRDDDKFTKILDSIKDIKSTLATLIAKAM